MGCRWELADPVGRGWASVARQIENAEADDDRPARILVRTVLDWYRTGIAAPMPVSAAHSLPGLPPSEAEPAEIDDASDGG
jgi:hypothetical protein